MQTSFIAIISVRILSGANAIAQVSPSPTKVQGITPLGAAIGTIAGFSGT